MSIQLPTQSGSQSLDQILSTLKSYKRNNDKITTYLREQHLAQANTLQQQSLKTVRQIQYAIKNCEHSYLNPQSAKKVMLIKRQFKEEKDRVGKEFYRAKEMSKNHQREQVKQEDQGESLDGFDYQVENRLIKEKGESLNKVNHNINNIQQVMLQTQSLTYKQGEDLDLISDDLDKTKDNMSSTNDQLEQANKYSKQHNKKCLYLALLGLILACVILIMVMLF